MRQKRELPEGVKRAIVQEDKLTLSIMGRKGGQVAAQRGDERRTMKAAAEERRAKEDAEFAREANEDLLPHDIGPSNAPRMYNEDGSYDILN